MNRIMLSRMIAVKKINKIKQQQQQGVRQTILLQQIKFFFINLFFIFILILGFS